MPPIDPSIWQSPPSGWVGVNVWTVDLHRTKNIRYKHKRIKMILDSNIKNQT